MFWISEVIPDCHAIPSNPAACYMFIGDGAFEGDFFKGDFCEDKGGYPPRLTTDGAGQELLNIFSPSAPAPRDKMWVGLTTSVDPYVHYF